VDMDIEIVPSRSNQETFMSSSTIIKTHQLIGQSEFNYLRSKAISLHIKVISYVCERLGISTKTRQYLVCLARDNGKKLGLLA
jgi:hypothetical protein